MRKLVAVFIGVPLAIILIVMVAQFSKGSQSEDETQETKKVLAEIGLQKLNDAKPGSGDGATNAEKIIAGAKELDELVQESTSDEMVKYFKQMQNVLNGKPGSKLPDRTAITKFTKRLGKIEEAVRNTRGPQSEFIETAFGQVKKTRELGLRTFIKPNKLNRTLHFELLFDAAHFDDAMDSNSSIGAAKQLATAECELLKREFAEKCEYSWHAFNRFDLRGGEKVIYFAIRVRFSQKGGVGNAPPLNDGEYLEFKKKSSNLIKKNIHRYWVNDPKRMAAYRYKSYRQIAKRCESLRRIWGNCSITHIVAGAERRLFRMEHLYFTSKVEFGVLHHAG